MFLSFYAIRRFWLRWVRQGISRGGDVIGDAAGRGAMKLHKAVVLFEAVLRDCVMEKQQRLLSYRVDSIYTVTQSFYELCQSIAVVEYEL